MRKTISLIITAGFIFLMSNSVAAQEKQDEIYISYAPSILSAQSFYEGTLEVISAIFGPGNEADLSAKSTGIIAIGYNRFLGERLKLGLSASYLKHNNTTDFKKDGALVGQSEWTDSFITTMLRLDFHYVRKEKITMYSGISVGACFVNGENIKGAEDVTLPDNTIFAFQLNAFGIRYGNDLGFFLESGFGFNGLISGGINYQF